VEVHRNLDNINFNRPVLTIGIFDGVHYGHHKIIDQLKKTALTVKGESVVFTLWPHPRIVLDKKTDLIGLLNTLDEKINLLEKTGIDHLVIHKFDTSIAKMSACNFIENILVKKIGINNLIIGFNHQFGHKRKGDYTEYENCAGKFGFSIEKVDSESVNGINISSTLIRNAIKDGRIDLSRQYLGYNYRLQGKVIHGAGIGSKLNYPTANIELVDKHKLIPGDGVYAVKVFYDGNYFPSMLNIGHNPTIGNNNKRTIEVNIFDFDKDIYNENIEIIFYDRIRNEFKFENTGELIQQLEKDKNDTLKILDENK